MVIVQFVMLVYQRVMGKHGRKHGRNHGRNHGRLGLLKDFVVRFFVRLVLLMGFVRFFC